MEKIVDFFILNKLSQIIPLALVHKPNNIHNNNSNKIARTLLDLVYKVVVVPADQINSRFYWFFHLLRFKYWFDRMQLSFGFWDNKMVPLLEEKESIFPVE